MTFNAATELKKRAKLVLAGEKQEFADLIYKLIELTDADNLEWHDGRKYTNTWWWHYYVHWYTSGAERMTVSITRHSVGFIGCGNSVLEIDNEVIATGPGLLHDLLKSVINYRKREDLRKELADKQKQRAEFSASEKKAAEKLDRLAKKIEAKLKAVVK